MIINPKKVLKIFFWKIENIENFWIFSNFWDFDPQTWFSGVFCGWAHPFSALFLKFLKTLESFSYPHQGHITLGWKVISGWKSLKMAKTPRNHSPLVHLTTLGKKLEFGQTPAKIAQNGLKMLQKFFFHPFWKTLL